SHETRQRLLQNLLDHDQRWRVDYRKGLAKKVESDMISMMDQLSELIEKEEPLFKGKMLQCGSSYNRTKVGQPDEMDFAFQWNLSENRSKKILGVKFYPQG
ncbi:unnamed protein product, partial [Porites evermanni]